MFSLGFESFSEYSKKDIETVTEKLGGTTAGAFGAVAVKAIIGSLGTTSRLSGAGIMSGLRTLGTLVGGGAVAGITVAATIPLVTGGRGMGLN